MVKKVFKIMVIGLLTKNNVIKKHGELIEESELTRPSADLLAENFIVEASKEDIKSAAADDKDDELENKKQVQIDADLKAKEESDKLDAEEAEKKKQVQIDADLKAKEESDKVKPGSVNPLDKLKK